MAMAHIVFFAKSNNSHLPFKDLGSIGMSTGPPMDSKGCILGFFEDRCKDSKGIDGFLNDSYKDFWDVKDLCKVSIRTQRGYEALLDGFYEDCCNDSVRISMRILEGFKAILLDSDKDFYKDSKGFYRFSMMMLLGSLSGFWRISTGQGCL